MKRWKIIFLILTIIFIAHIGYIRYSDFLGNNRAIEYSLNKYRVEKDDYVKILKLIKKMDIPTDYSFRYYFQTDTIIFYNLSTNISFKISNDIFSEFYKTLVKLPRRRITVRNGISVIFSTEKFNLSGNSHINIGYRLNNSITLEKQYSDFEIVNNEERPSRSEKWIYIIDKNWYIYVK